MKITRRILSALFALIFLCTAALGEAIPPVEAPAPEKVPQAAEAEAEPAEESLEEAPVEELPAEEIPAEALAEEIPAEAPVEEVPAEEIPEEWLVEELPAEAVPLAAAADGFEISGTTLTKYTGSEADITIPEGVTKIGSNAFESCTSLRSVTIPQGVVELGMDAFLNCTNLQTVAMADSVQGIVQEAFKGCTSLTEVQLSPNITSIPYAFINCSSLQHIELPENLQYLSGSFEGCSQLQSVQIPSGIKNIGSNTFSGCTSLNQVSIPSGVTEIQSSAFKNCSSLTNIDIPSDVSKIGYSAFAGCTGLQAIQLPDGLIELGNSCFEGCSGLTAIRVPDRIAQIDYNTFRNCTNLQTIELPAQLSSIKYQAFQGCAALQKIDIPQSVTSIGYGAFKDCAKLSTIALPKGVTSIGQETFSGCTALTSIDFLDGVTSIGNNAFANCDGLRDVHIPASVTTIGSANNYGAPFNNCKNLNSLTIERGEAPLQVYGSICSDSPLKTAAIEREIANGAASEGGSHYGNEFVFEDLTSLRSITISEGVTSLPESFCCNCGFEAIQLPASLTSIPRKAFDSCDNLRTIEIPAQVASIGEYAFCSCGNLWKVDLPQGLSSIGDHAFDYCEKLTALSLPEALQSIGKYAFTGCGVASFDIPSGVTEIPEGAFSSYYLTSVKLPETLTAIGPKAFQSSHISEIEIPQGVSTIGSQAFAGSSLHSISLPAGLSAIESGLFDGCEYLVSVTVPGNISEIQSYAFQGCTALSSATLESGVTTLGTGAFKDCTDLGMVKLPASLNRIDPYAFQNCDKLTAFVTAGSEAESYCKTNGIPYTTGELGKIEFTGVQDGESISTHRKLDLQWKAVSGANAYVVSWWLGEEIPGESGQNWWEVENVEVSSPSYTIEAHYDGQYLYEFRVSAYKTSGSSRTLLAEGKITLRPDSSLNTISFPSSLSLGVGQSVIVTARSDQDSSFTYGSTNKQVATISSSGKVKALKAGTTTLTAQGNDSGDIARCELTVTVLPTKLSFSPAKMDIGIGQALKLSPVLSPEGAASELSFDSSNPAVARVDGDGVVTGVSAGSASITAKTANGKTASCAITVKPAPSSVSFNPAELTLYAGRSATLKPVLSPANSAAGFSYESDNPSAAIVRDGGVVEAVAAGEARITATAHNGVQGSIAVHVLPAPTKIELPESEVTLGKGEKLTLHPSIGDDAGAEFSYESSKAAVASVSAAGKITARKAGDATITVSGYGLSASCHVTVVAAPSKISLDAKKATLGVNATLALEAVLPAGSASALTWSSSKDSVASVDQSGLVTAHQAGSATISVKAFNKKKASCKITVKAAPTSVSFEPASLKLADGQEFQLKPVLSPGSAASFTYASDDEEIASVDEDGILTAGKPGTATITVTAHNGPSAQCEVTVVPAPKQLSIAAITLGKGEKAELQPTVDSGADSDVPLFSYSIKKTSIAKIGADGWITGKAAGSTILTVETYNGLKAQCDLTVTAAPKSVSFSLKKITMSPGCKLQLEAKLNGESSSKLSYESSAPGIASVDASGTVTAVAPGSATITVSTYNKKKASFQVIVE